MLNIEYSESPIQKLRRNQDAPLDDFSILVSAEEIQEFKDYIKELLLENGQDTALLKAKKLLLLYAAAISFVVMSFDPDEYLDIELLEVCDELAKLLYTQYRELYAILIIKQIEGLWKSYVKLRGIAEKIPVNSVYKVHSSRDRILKGLALVRLRIKNQ